MKVAHIVPTRFLPDIERCDYHMALAHEALNDADYANWYQMQAVRGSFVILDNGVWENVDMDVNQVLDIAKEMRASEIVLPDVLRDGPSSLEKTLRGLEKAVFAKQHADWNLKLAAVVQGATSQEWMQSYDVLNKESHIDTIMLPKTLDNNLWGSGGRFAACCYLKATDRINSSKQYHLLGIWSDPTEVWLQAVYNGDWIRGVDTALAFQAGMQSVSLRQMVSEGGIKPSRPENYFNTQHVGKEELNIVADNMALLEKWSTANGKNVTQKKSSGTQRSKASTTKSTTR